VGCLLDSADLITAAVSRAILMLFSRCGTLWKFFCLVKGADKTRTST